MIAILEQTVEALRDELLQYGEMLVLLEAQQRAAAQHGPDAELISCPSFAAQIGAIHEAQAERATCQSRLAWAYGCVGPSTLRDLIPRLPEAYRPIIAALLRENLQLLRRIRERAHQNHHLLRRSLDSMQQCIDQFSSQEISALLGEEPDSFAADSDGSSHRAAAG
jgi:hypothetical protein